MSQSFKQKSELRAVAKIGAEPVKPVQIFDCPACQGTGYREGRNEVTQRCGQCYGRGKVATGGGEP